MPTERRLITFSAREVREAILMLPTSARPAVWDENDEIRLGQGTSVNVKLAGHTDVEVTQDKVGSALLLFCKAERIPIPRQGRKALRRDEAGITGVLVSAKSRRRSSRDFNLMVMTFPPGKRVGLQKPKPRVSGGFPGATLDSETALTIC